jgi:hypothetical protein
LENRWIKQVKKSGKALWKEKTKGEISQIFSFSIISSRRLLFSTGRKLLKVGKKE